MYLKVPYHKDADGVTRDATVEQVEQAIRGQMDGLTVDMALRFPCVEFPATATYADYQRIQRVLLDTGFEAY